MVPPRTDAAGRGGAEEGAGGSAARGEAESEPRDGVRAAGLLLRAGAAVRHGDREHEARRVVPGLSRRGVRALRRADEHDDAARRGGGAVQEGGREGQDVAVQLREPGDAGAAGAKRLHEGVRVSGQGDPDGRELRGGVRAASTAVYADAGEREGERGSGEGDGAVPDEQRLEAGVRNEDLAAVPDGGAGQVPAADQGGGGLGVLNKLEKRGVFVAGIYACLFVCLLTCLFVGENKEWEWGGGGVPPSQALAQFELRGESVRMDRDTRWHARFIPFST